MAGKTGKFGGHNPLNLPIDGVGGGAASSIASKSTWPVQDTMHMLHSAESVRSGASAAHHASGGLFGMISSHLGGFLGVAAGTAISAYINHLVHGHHEKAMLDRYRPQIASITGKDETAVTVDDMDAVAKYNRSLDQELDRNRGKRNLHTVAALLGSTVAFGAVVLAATTFPPLAALGVAAAHAGLFSGAGLGFLTACTAVSFGTLHVFGKGAKKLGEKLLGYNAPSVEDHIHGIDGLYKKGEHITPEQVMGVYVASNKGLQANIKNAFGKEYEKLPAAQQKQAEEMFGSNLPLEQVAAAINAGEMNPRELMFSIHGQASGIHNKSAEREHKLNEDTGAALDKAQGQAVVPHDVAASQSRLEAKRAEASQNSQWRALLEKQRSSEQAPDQPAR